MLHLIDDTFTGNSTSRQFSSWLKGYGIGADRAGFSYIDISLPLEAKRTLMSHSVKSVNREHTDIFFSEKK